MGVNPNFNMGSMSDKLKAFEKQVDAATLLTLQYLGEELVNYAKENITFMPQTGNLQNSIGYVVVKAGRIINTGGFGGASSISAEGSQTGLQLALKVAKQTPAAYCLIIVAGMNYAAAVEAKGYNVILPAELKAKIEFPIELKKLTEKAKAKAKLI